MEVQTQQQNFGPKKTFDVVIKDNWQIILFFLVISMGVGQYTFKLSSIESRLTAVETSTDKKDETLQSLSQDMAVVKTNLEFIKDKLEEK